MKAGKTDQKGEAGGRSWAHLTMEGKSCWLGRGVPPYLNFIFYYVIFERAIYAYIFNKHEDSKMTTSRGHTQAIPDTRVHVCVPPSFLFLFLSGHCLWILYLSFPYFKIPLKILLPLCVSLNNKLFDFVSDLYESGICLCCLMHLCLWDPSTVWVAALTHFHEFIHDVV